ncbi:MAG TPA: DUF5683 domain-containing protein [Bacteroidales bacterium]|nr:DUF5683 domain-containing protein [Bacteroidales bacterium]
MILLFAIPFLSTSSVCQEDLTADDSLTVKHHSPTTAVIMSAIVPGLGQIYNEKIWKLPIIYGGEMAAINSFHFYQIRYKKVLSILKEDGGTGQEEYEVYGLSISSRNLERARDFYRRWRDYSGLVVVGVYALNIIDALVDAHFFEYDISDDLSLKIRPDILPYDFHSRGIGLNICMRF